MDYKNSVSAIIVADQLLWLRKGVDTTVMHILKLVYLSHGWMLGFYDSPLIKEPVEAWRYGPVISDLYHMYKAFRAEPIDSAPINRSEILDTYQKNVIKVVNDSYIKYTALDLSALTHEYDSPWDKVQRTSGFNCIIPNKVIQDYYKNLIKKG